jgi:asparagine synthase (glutamine-hydrolysing)
MCGIAGVLHTDPARAADAALLDRMNRVLAHRGPDDAGIHREGPLGLATRRLAIIDLSARARQPMSNEDGSLTITFNGEIYNFQALRADLQRKGHAFRSDSDTEAILHLYEDEGVACLDHLRGMFAFALWDAKRRVLFAARDRLGKKPLVYYHDATTFLFASEPKAILQDPGVRTGPDPEAIHHFLTYGYVPSPWSAFRGIRKLPPAHYLLVRDGRLSVHRYWSLSYAPKRTESEAALAEELLALLEEAVRLRLISDVPLGALLSGGIDSSAVVALMRRLVSGPIRTFSIGFDQPEYDELAYARQVAVRFETDHRERVVKPDAVAVLPRLVWHYNEPFADSSALPSLYLAEMAREAVTVALNGDGGDEAFVGYQRYLATVLAGWQDRLPAWLRRALPRATRLLPAGGPKSAAHGIQRFAAGLALDRRRRYGHWLSVFDGDAKRELYTREFAAAVGSTDSLALLEAAYAASDAPGFLEATVHADVQLYLPDDLLVKMDIASMASSLEVRSPFLDHRVVEFAARLPARLKLRGLTQKYLVRQVMRTILPDPVLRRKKMGFGVPIDHWFRHELREMAYDLLLDARARQRGYLRPEVVRRYLDEHAQGRAHHHARLWSLLVLELWHRMFVDRPCPAEAPGPL